MKYRLDTLWFNQHGRLKVRDIIPAVEDEMMRCSTPQYEILKTSLEEHGQKACLHISSDLKILQDGIHRLVIADLLGWGGQWVSTEKDDWTEWDESSTGRTYWNLWRQRLGIEPDWS
jgi:hypothetical protein